MLAGEAVLDAWPGGVPPGSKARVIEALVPTMQAAAVPAPLRRRAGLLLGRLGWLPPDLDEFVAVPAGEFLYGDDKQKRRIPYRYWIGKYPVTNAQYARFIADKGYERQELWSADGWRWRIGSYDTTATEKLGEGLAGASAAGSCATGLSGGTIRNAPTPSSRWSASRGSRRKPMPTGSTRGLLNCRLGAAMPARLPRAAGDRRGMGACGARHGWP